jgi:hypothetical protein
MKHNGLDVVTLAHDLLEPTQFRTLTIFRITLFVHSGLTVPELEGIYDADATIWIPVICRPAIFNGSLLQTS